MTWERRRSIRSPLRACGALELLDGRQPPVAFGVTITDVSSGGIGVISGAPLPVGVQARLSLKEGVLFGSIVHCEAVDNHYIAGLVVLHDPGILSRLRWLASLSPVNHPAAWKAPAANPLSR